MLEKTIKIKSNGTTTFVVSALCKDSFKEVLKNQLNEIIENITESNEIFDIKIHMFSEYVDESISLELK